DPAGPHTAGAKDSRSRSAGTDGIARTAADTCRSGERRTFVTRQSQDSPVKTLLAVVASIGVPVTVLGALIYYLGWAYTDRYASLIGLDETLFGYTSQDYM